MLPDDGSGSVELFNSVEDVAPDLLHDGCLAVDSTADAPSEMLDDLSPLLSADEAGDQVSPDSTLTDLLDSAEGQDHVHFDLDGNQYDVLTALPTLDLDEANLATGDQLPSAGLLPLSETFLLNSNPGASHTIYLDFDGHVTSGTYWNTSFNGGQDIVTPAFDLDGNGSSFSDAELTRIQYIWQRVAEDFIPFDVNVTTQDPGLDALIKSGSGDTDWGVRVAIGGSSSDWYGSTAGGVAYYNSFNWSSDTPVFVFTAQLGGGAEKFTAEAISHETGHALNLGHDGRTSPSETYYAGHGSGDTGWAPIMGNSYYKNLTQWSRGEYPYASNTQDDLAVITTNNGFGYRLDDHGDTNSQASLLDITGSDVNDFGIIERNTDVDVFFFNTTGGDISLQIDPASSGPNLDILASLYDGVGTLITSSNPIGYLNATINATLAAGQYYLHIEGVGEGTPTTGGYSDYGSLGQYFIRGTVAPSNDSYLSIAAADAAQLEGNAGDSLHTFTVTRSGDTSSAASVHFQVAGTGSNAASAADFAGGVLPSGLLSFAAGETSKTISIAVAGDDLVEMDETYSVTLNDPSGSTLIATGTAFGTILNDDVAVTPSYVSISATDAHRLEGDSGTTLHTFTVNRTGDTSQAVSVEYHVSGTGTHAASASDFAAGTLPSGLISFAAGETSKTITVQIAGDEIVEADETYSVVLSNPSESTVIANGAATGTILNDDVPVVSADPGITVSPTSGLTTTESGGSASFTVVLNSQPTADVIVRLTSLDPSEGTVSVSSLTFTAADWNQSQTVTVRGVDDAIRDTNVTYTIQVTAESDDAAYDVIDPDDVVLTNTDDEKGKPIKDGTDSGGDQNPGKKTPPGLSKGEAVVDGSMEVLAGESFNSTVDQLLKSLEIQDPSGHVAGLQWALDLQHGPAPRSGEGGLDGAGGNPWLNSDRIQHEFGHDPLAKALQAIYGRDTNDDDSL
jgi:hypothetical protein